MTPEVVFFSNGPGEVIGWLAPALCHLRSELADMVRITVMIPPCDFASGREHELVERLGGVDQVVPPGRYLRFLFMGSRASGVRFESKRGVVVHLGGDHFQSGLIARRLGYRAIAYTEGRIHHRGFFDILATDYEESREKLIRAGVSPGQVVTVGNLMVDGVAAGGGRAVDVRWMGLDPGRLVIGLLPGSRARWLDLTLRLLADAADCVGAEDPEVQFVLLLAPTVSFAELSSVARDLGMDTSIPLTDGEDGSGSSMGHVAQVVTKSGTNMVAVASNRYDTMNCMDIAVTLPGTNTMELASLGVPMVVVVPLNEPERIPLEGLPGLIGGIPFIGPWIKGKAVSRLAARIGFAALPNRRASMPLVPEVKGSLSGLDIAAPVLRLLSSPSERQRLSERLKNVAGPPGAAKRLVALIVGQLSISENA